MIIIKTNAVQGDLPFEYVIEGHAGYAESGKDIVCSAISALHYSLTNWMEREGIEFDSFDDGESAGVSISDERARDCFCMVVGAFDGIAQSYGVYVKIIYT